MNTRYLYFIFPSSKANKFYGWRIDRCGHRIKTSARGNLRRKPLNHYCGWWRILTLVLTLFICWAHLMTSSGQPQTITRINSDLLSHGNRRHFCIPKTSEKFCLWNFIQALKCEWVLSDLLPHATVHITQFVVFQYCDAICEKNYWLDDTSDDDKI